MKKIYKFFLLILNICFIINFNQPIFSNNIYSDLLNFDQILKISRPSSIISVESDTYCITGTCNPNEPLYINNEKITNVASGIFDKEVNLKSGENKFIVKQDNNEEIVTIFKDTPTSEIKNQSICSNNKQSNITPPYPNKSIIVTNQKLNLSCYAPTNSTVNALIDGNEFDLYPIDSETNENTSQAYTQFTCEAEFEDEKYETTYYNAGPVKYIITHGSNEKEILSDGCVIFADDENLSTQFIEVTNSRTSIFEKPDRNSKSFTTIKQGCILETDQSEELDNWFKLKDNLGYILKSSVCPASPKSNIKNIISNTKFTVNNNKEQLILSGTCKPAFAAILSSDKLMVRLYYTTGIKIDQSIYKTSQIIDSININQQSAQSDIIFNFQTTKRLLGYNVEYNGNNTIIYLKTFPKVTDNDKPLKNINIMLNAGHGGSDYGALGLLGNVDGPTEKDINLAYTKTLKDALEKIGANVYLTRESDINDSLNNIANLTEKIKPDVFISIHSDSVSNDINPNKINGFTIYYSNLNSQQLAKKINLTLSKNINDIKSRGIKQNEYYVIKSTISPSILFEIGMITNPSDTRNLISNEYITNWAENLAFAIKDYFSNESET